MKIDFKNSAINNYKILKPNQQWTDFVIILHSAFIEILSLLFYSQFYFIGSFMDVFCFGAVC